MKPCDVVIGLPVIVESDQHNKYSIKIDLGMGDVIVQHEHSIKCLITHVDRLRIDTIRLGTILKQFKEKL